MHNAQQQMMAGGPPDQPGPVPMQMLQPGPGPPYPPGRGGGGAMPIMMYPPHMGIMMSGPPPNMPQAGGVPPQQGGPVFLPGPHQQYMVPMMPGMPMPMGASGPHQHPPHLHQPQGFAAGPMGISAPTGGPGMGPGGLAGPAGPSGRLPGDLPGRQPGQHGASRNTPLRANAPSFVPGSLKASTSSANGNHHPHRTSHHRHA
jgi:hypothetical protein